MINLLLFEHEMKWRRCHESRISSNISLFIFVPSFNLAISNLNIIRTKLPRQDIFFLRDIVCSLRNQDKGRSILSASTECNLIFSPVIPAAQVGKGFPLWSFNCEDFPRVVTPPWHFSWLNALRFKKGFLKNEISHEWMESADGMPTN